MLILIYSYTERSSKVGFLKVSALNLNKASRRLRQLNLNKLGDAGGF